jgi:heme/copper-type cytochrome/quinol oxidase subunit 1
METFVKGFIRASLVWLGIGVLMGVSMVFVPATNVYRAAHMHANLLGFVSMMIFGVAYHVIPRFSGRPLHSRKLPLVHFWVANGGLALMVIGWVMRGTAGMSGELALRIGAVLGAGGAFLFIYNLWRTLAPPVTSEGRRLPTVEGPVGAGRP